MEAYDGLCGVRRVIDAALDCCCIVGDPVADSAIAAHVEAARRKMQSEHVKGVKHDIDSRE